MRVSFHCYLCFLGTFSCAFVLASSNEWMYVYRTAAKTEYRQLRTRRGAGWTYRQLRHCWLEHPRAGGWCVERRHRRSTGTAPVTSACDVDENGRLCPSRLLLARQHDRSADTTYHVSTTAPSSGRSLSNDAVCLPVCLSPTSTLTCIRHRAPLLVTMQQYPAMGGAYHGAIQCTLVRVAWVIKTKVHCMQPENIT